VIQFGSLCYQERLVNFISVPVISLQYSCVLSISMLLCWCTKTGHNYSALVLTAYLLRYCIISFDLFSWCLNCT
jgi:hypothetical protein